MVPTVTPDAALAARVIAAGGLVAFPTETVYGLGADAESAAAVRRVFAAKGRPADHPLIVHAADADVLDRYGAEVSPLARRLADAFWPGPLTLVVTRGPRVSDAVVAGLDGVGLRVPSHPLAAELLRLVGRGVAAPSANRYGRTSPTEAAHVVADLGDAVDVVLDGGPSDVGVESTIIDARGDRAIVLRAGGVPLERIAEAAGHDVVRGEHGPSRAPGMREAHYSPLARVELVSAAQLPQRVEARRAAGLAVCVIAQDPPRMPGTRILVPAPGDDGYAHDVYRLLRQADAVGADVVLAVPPPDAGLGTAVGDRLRRAAAAGQDAVSGG